MFNSAGTVEAMVLVNIKSKLEQLINGNLAIPGGVAIDELLVGKVTANIVKQACCRMKPGKTGLFQ